MSEATTSEPSVGMARAGGMMAMVMGGILVFFGISLLITAGQLVNKPGVGGAVTMRTLIMLGMGVTWAVLGYQARLLKPDAALGGAVWSLVVGGTSVWLAVQRENPGLGIGVAVLAAIVAGLLWAGRTQIVARQRWRKQHR